MSILLNFYKLIHDLGLSEKMPYLLKAIEVTSNRTINKINSINNLLSKTIEIVQTEEPKYIERNLLSYFLNNLIQKLNNVV